MERKAQTAIEYLLLLSGVITFVIVVFLLAKGNFNESNESIKSTTDTIWNVLRNVGK